MRLICKKNGQQEIVGFVLIVVLVVVALMIFLVISLNKPVVTANSKFSESFLSSIMGYTTDCIINEPYRETMRDLIESCYKNEKCVNLNKPSCDYLNETMSSVMNDLQASENTISSYLLTIYWENDEQTSQQAIEGFPMGKKCTGGTLKGETTSIYVNSGRIRAFLELCQEKTA